MFLDAQNLFSDAQAVTATAASTNLIDLGAATVDLGVGEPVYFICQIDTTMADTGSDSTITVTLEIDTAAAFGSATVAQTIGTFAALAAAGTRLVALVQPEAVVEQFLRVNYTTANGNLSAGAFTAFLTKDIHAYQAYPDNVTIS